MSASDDRALQHILQCALCSEVLEALERKQPKVRAKHRRVVALVIAVATSALAATLAWALLARPAMIREQKAPSHSGEAARHNHFGVEGPRDEREPHMAREAAREAAANAGVIGVLESSVPTPLDNDPMSALGALMGDQVAGNFGFGGLGLRATGRGGSDIVGTIGLATAEAGPERELDQGRARGRGHGQQKQPERTRDPAPARRTDWKKPEPGRQLKSPPPRQRAQLTQTQPRSEPLASPPANAAEELLARYSTLEDVQFIDANGYFANTYVPGDPELRALHARMHGYDRSSLLPQNLREARFDTASARVLQPFDPPGRVALAVYVSASERGITGARRMLLQVGLHATPRFSGRRPAMNVSLVLDAREPLSETAHANVRALLSAFADAREPSDKFTLFAAGPGGGRLVAEDAFKHRPLSVALQRLQSERSGATLSLADALQAALHPLRGSDDPRAPLGSSVAIVVAPQAFAAELAQLEAIAHASAVEGVPVSVFGVGSANPEPLSRLALAGQGNRRMIDVAQDAARAVDRELSAVARVVARAVRLRIRLASGVRLVGVLGSHPLDQAHAERVREAENATDQRLRRELGIGQDRGEDEEGVQIVIPSFYAGDSHVLLLDVVADGPGQIADVSVRYKDLVQLSNGSARESLWLPNLELARGALQRNVLKNLVAHELADRLRSAGDALASGAGAAPARRTLDQALALLDSLTNAVPELRGDRELETDRAFTAEYLALLAHADRVEQRQFAIDSLHLASRLKLQPRPESDAARTGGTALR